MTPDFHRRKPARIRRKKRSPVLSQHIDDVKHELAAVFLTENPQVEIFHRRFVRGVECAVDEPRYDSSLSHGGWTHCRHPVEPFLLCRYFVGFWTQHVRKSAYAANLTDQRVTSVTTTPRESGIHRFYS